MTFWQGAGLLLLTLILLPFAAYYAGKLWTFGKRMGNLRFRQWLDRQAGKPRGIGRNGSGEHN